jgi:uncharacterized Tic20 family protein
MKARGIATGVTQDERIMAALAHASVILPFWGIIGAIVVWATQREKSRFVGFQALQAGVYQLALILGGMLCFACYMCSMFATFPLAFLLAPAGILAAEATQGPAEAGGAIGGVLAMLTSFFPFCILGLLVLLGFVYILYALYGAAQVLQGRDFRYVIIGRRLERYLSQEESAG